MSWIDWVMPGRIQEPIGAIDVVAIKRFDGSISCGPFHARFSKVAKKGEKNIVKLIVNGQESRISMKLGPMGEVFFVEKTKERVQRLSSHSPKTHSNGGVADDNSGTSFRRVRSFSAGDLSAQDSKLKNSELTCSIAKLPLGRQLVSPLSINGEDCSSLVMKTDQSFSPRAGGSGSLPRDHVVSPSSRKNRERSHSEGGDGTFSRDLSHQDLTVESVPGKASTSSSIWTWAWGAFPVEFKSAIESEKKLISNSMEKLHEDFPFDASTIFSFCAEYLSTSTPKASPEFSPQTPEQLNRLLMKYRLGTKRSRKEIIGHESFFRENDVISNFSFSENWLLGIPPQIIENPNLVIVIDDFLLPGVVGYQILMIIYHSRDEFEIKRPLTEDDIARFLKEKCVIDMISLNFFPRWFGKKVSQWDPTNNGKTSITSNIFLSPNVGNPEQFPEVSHPKFESDLSLERLESRRWSSFVDLNGHLNFNIICDDIETSPKLNAPPNSRELSTMAIAGEDKSQILPQSIWDDIDDSVEIDIGSTNDDVFAIALPTDVPLHETVISMQENNFSGSPLERSLLENVFDGDDADTEGESIEDSELSLLSIEDISPEPARGDIYDSDTDSYYSLSLSLEDGESGAAGARKYRYRKSLVPTQEHLLELNLKDGENEVVFQLEGCPPLKSTLYLWSESTKLVVSDIEGAITVTKSVGGVLGFFQSKNSTHDGVDQLLNNISKNGYKIIYIAAKPLQHRTDTKEHISRLLGQESNLPTGPIFQSPETLIRSFGTERTSIFKASVLRGIRVLFPDSQNPFHAGFGTRKSDMHVFARCGFPSGRIFLVNEKGDVKGNTMTLLRTFKDIDDEIDVIFPCVEGVKHEDTFASFNYWRLPMPSITSFPKVFEKKK